MSTNLIYFLFIYFYYLFTYLLFLLKEHHWIHIAINSLAIIAKKITHLFINRKRITDIIDKD